MAEAKEEAMRKKAEIENRTIATLRKTAKTKKQQTAKKAAEAASKPQTQRTLDDVVSSIPLERIKAPVVPENYLDQPPPESSVPQPRAGDSFYTDAS